MNMKQSKTEKQIADLLKVLGSPFRIQLLYALGEGEACVCHLETILKKRQAYISQHLMVMRDAGLLDTRREGKYIYYRVADKASFTMLEKAAGLVGISPDQLPEIASGEANANCACPKVRTGVFGN